MGSSRKSKKSPASGRRKKDADRRLHPIHHMHFTLCVLLAVQVLLLALLGLSDGRVARAGTPPAPAGKVWQQVWADEFNGSSVDGGKWNVIENSNYGAANKEDQCYRSSNVSVTGGALRLIANRETVACGATNPDTGNNTYYFTSGMVTTRAQGGAMKYKFKQGYIEARVKAPKGNPYWPAFWLVGPNDGSTPGWPDYGEFDIFELYGIRPDVTNGAMHYKCTSGDGHCKTAPTWYNLKTDSAYGGSSTLGTQITTQSALNAYTGGTTDFNTYGFLWESNKISWYVNGRLYRYFDGNGVYRIEQNGTATLEATTATLGPPAIPFSTVFAYDHSIILNLAVGGDGPQYSYYGYTGQDTASGFVDGNYAVANSTMEVDYVRVYQLANAPDPTPPPATTPPPAAPAEEPQPTAPEPAPAGKPATTVTDPKTNEVVTVADDNTVVSGDVVLDPTLVTEAHAVAKVEYYVGGKLVQSVDKPPFRLDTTKLPRGKHNVTEKIYFKDGTVKSSSVLVTVDNEAETGAQGALAPVKTIVAVVLSAGLLIFTLVTYILSTPPWRKGILAKIGRKLFRRNYL